MDKGEGEDGEEDEEEEEARSLIMSVTLKGTFRWLSLSSSLLLFDTILSG